MQGAETLCQQGALQAAGNPAAAASKHLFQRCFAKAEAWKALLRFHSFMASPLSSSKLSPAKRLRFSCFFAASGPQLAAVVVLFFVLLVLMCAPMGVCESSCALHLWVTPQLATTAPPGGSRRATSNPPKTKCHLIARGAASCAVFLFAVPVL